jgi:glycosyltransferase involved in cell wall biosynthesis
VAKRLRIAYLSYSTGEYDARTFRMARSALDAGFDVRVYSRWHPGLPLVDRHDGFEVVRLSFDWRLAIPGLRGWARRRAARAMARQAATTGTSRRTPISRSALRRLGLYVLKPVLTFPIAPLGWAESLELAAEPADIWHGMWAGSLPALIRLRRRHGGQAIYDSRDVFIESRRWARLPGPERWLLRRIERRWAGQVDRVLTVNDAYARLLADGLGVPTPEVVMNCPPMWAVPNPRPDKIRAALGLPGSTRIILYQGQLISDRGIEQAMDAILQVPDAVLVLLGFGEWEARYRERAAAPGYDGRVAFLPAVPPGDLLGWTASADVMVMAIQPTTLNHRFTTPQKLFESLAAGVPVVASDLPGMSSVIRATGAGLLCDPTSPESIATAIRAVLDAEPGERAALRERAQAAAHDTYNWETQAEVLLALYRDLAGDDALSRPAIKRAAR